MVGWGPENDYIEESSTSPAYQPCQWPENPPEPDVPDPPTPPLQLPADSAVTLPAAEVIRPTRWLETPQFSAVSWMRMALICCSVASLLLLLLPVAKKSPSRELDGHYFAAVICHLSGTIAAFLLITFSCRCHVGVSTTGVIRLRDGWKTAAFLLHLIGGITSIVAGSLHVYLTCKPEALQLHITPAWAIAAALMFLSALLHLATSLLINFNRLT